MDSEERHHLKENELADFFANFGQWWERYGNIVLLVLVLGAGAFAGYRLYNYWTYGAQQAAFGELAGTTTVQGYAYVAEEHRQPTVKALAYLRGGDLALDAAVRPQEQPEQNEDEAEDTGVADMSPAEALDRAQAMYRSALDAARHDPFRVNALIGLAQVAETRGEWEQASTHYREAEQLATDANLPSLARQANQRQTLIEQLQEPVVFAPEAAAPEVPEGPEELTDFSTSSDFLQDDVQNNAPGDAEGTIELEDVIVPEGEGSADTEGDTAPEAPAETE